MARNRPRAGTAATTGADRAGAVLAGDRQRTEHADDQLAEHDPGQGGLADPSRIHGAADRQRAGREQAGSDRGGPGGEQAQGRLLTKFDPRDRAQLGIVAYESGLIRPR